MFHHQDSVQIVNVSFELIFPKMYLIRCVLLFPMLADLPQVKHCEAARNGTVSYPNLNHSGYLMNVCWIKKKNECLLCGL